MFLNVFRQFQLITKIFTLFNDFISKKVSQFNNVVDVVTIFDIVRFVYHSYIVENVIFSGNKLK